MPREKERLQFFSPPFIKPVRLLTADELFYKSAPQPAAGRSENREAERATTSSSTSLFSDFSPKRRPSYGLLLVPRRSAGIRLRSTGQSSFPVTMVSRFAVRSAQASSRHSKRC